MCFDRNINGNKDGKILEVSCVTVRETHFSTEKKLQLIRKETKYYFSHCAQHSGQKGPSKVFGFLLIS
jgi:hypothetical protein